MPLSAPSQDQVMAQLRIVIPALGTIVSALGISSSSVNNITQIALASVGPIAYILCFIWSLIVNTKAAQIKTVQDIATGPAGADAASAQVAIIQATSAIAQDTTIPTSVAAGNALISATIALPQVQTIVTDKKTADAIPNPSVIHEQAA
jgi:hypothetical protein